MSFLRASIDSAIVVTQYKLGAFSFPGVIERDQEPKELLVAIDNFLTLAARGPEGEPPDESYVSISRGSFDECRGMCGCLAQACDLYQREAVQIIIQDIARLGAQMQAEMVVGSREPSPHVGPLSEENEWGKAVRALALAFHVPLKQHRAVQAELTQEVLNRFSGGDVQIVHNEEAFGSEGESLLLQGPTRSIIIEDHSERSGVSYRRLIVHFHWVAQNDGEPSAPAETWTLNETISDYGTALDRLSVKGVDAHGRLTIVMASGMDHLTLFLPGDNNLDPVKVRGLKSESVCESHLQQGDCPDAEPT